MSFLTIYNYCEVAKLHNYPVKNILKSQIEIKEDEVALELLVTSPGNDWWDEETLPHILTLLERTPKHLEQYLEKILLHLDRLVVDASIKERVALLWCRHPEFLFQRMKILLESQPLTKGFKCVREKLTSMGPTVKELPIPFLGDVRALLDLARNSKKIPIPKDLLDRMELRSIKKPGKRFVEILEKMNPDHVEGWKLAASIFIEGGNPQHLGFLLQNLQRNDCVEELLLVLHYALREDFSFDFLVGYTCAEKHPDVACDLISKMRSSRYFQPKMHPEIQAKVYALLALETKDMNWLTRALQIDLKTWSPLQEVMASCGEICENEEIVLALLEKFATIDEVDPSFKKMCSLWKKIPLKFYSKEILLKYHVFFSDRTEEPEFIGHVQKVIEENLRDHIGCFTLLRFAKLNIPGLWQPVYQAIASSKDVPMQRKLFTSWLDLPLMDQMIYLDIIATMVPVFSKEQLQAFMSRILDAELPLSHWLLCQIIDACSKIVNGRSEKKLLDTLLSLRESVVKCKKDLLLIQCLLTVPCYENLLAASTLFSLKSHDPGIFCVILQQVSGLNLPLGDDLSIRVLYQANELFSSQTDPNKMLTTASQLLRFPFDAFHYLAFKYFKKCFQKNNFEKCRKPALAKLLEKFLTMDGARIGLSMLELLESNYERVFQIVSRDKLPAYFYPFFDRYIENLSQEEKQSSSLYMYMYPYIQSLFVQHGRREAFDLFLDYFCTMIRYQEEPKPFVNSFTGLFKILATKNVHHMNCSYLVTRRLIEFLGTIPEDSPLYSVVYSALNIPQQISQQDFDIYVDFYNLWPTANKHLFVMHASTVYISGAALFRAGATSLGNRLLKTTFEKIVDQISTSPLEFEAKDFVLIIQCIKSLTLFIRNECSAKMFKKLIIEAIKKLEKMEDQSSSGELLSLFSSFK